MTDVASTPPIAGDRSTARRVAVDSGALLMANGAFLVTGMLRTKLAAVTLGPDGLGAVAQLTQLSALVVFVSALGMSTGTRLSLARANLSNDDRAMAGKSLLVILLGISIVGTAIAECLAERLASIYLGDSTMANELRIALLAVPIGTAAQLLLPIAQAWGDFRRIVSAAIATAVVGVAVTLPLLISNSLSLAVATIPAAAAVQLLCIIWASPAVRRTVRAQIGTPPGFLGEVVRVGAMSFVLGGAAMAGESLVRAGMVSSGGLELVASYQPIYLLSSSGFQLVLGAVVTALLVHVAREVATVNRAELSRSLNDVIVRVVLGVAILGFLSQVGARLYISVAFSGDVLGSARSLAFQMPVEVMRSVVWALGAVMLPLSLRRQWLLSGLAVVFVQTAATLALIAPLGLYAIPAASGAGWTAGLLVTVYGLRRSGVRLAPRTIALGVWCIAIQLASAAMFSSGGPYALARVPALFLLVWAIPVATVVARLRQPEPA